MWWHLRKKSRREAVWLERKKEKRWWGKWVILLRTILFGFIFFLSFQYHKANVLSQFWNWFVFKCLDDLDSHAYTPGFETFVPSSSLQLSLAFPTHSVYSGTRCRPNTIVSKEPVPWLMNPIPPIAIFCNYECHVSEGNLPFPFEGLKKVSLRVTW